MEPTPSTPPTPEAPTPQPVTPPRPEQQPEVEAVPSSWPGIFGVYKYSKAAIRFNLGTNVWLIIITAVLGGAAEAGSREGHNAFAGIIGYLLSMLFGAAFTLSQIASVRRTKLSFEGALKNALPLWIKYFLLTILVNITYIISFLLLVIPFFFVLPRLMLATYFLVDKRMGVLAAYKASWHATKGHLMKPWNVVAGNVLIGLLMFTIIGIPFSIYFYIMYSAALAVLYEMLQTAQPAAAGPTPPADIPPTPAATI
jgi:hypothetical protein